jgi:DNA-binding SARP family transcriptional activator
MPIAVGNVGGRMRINMLGETEVVGHQGALSLRRLGGTKPRQLLEILALHREEPLAKDQLVEWLWEGVMPVAPVAALTSYVSVLRSKIEPGVAPADSVIVTGDGTYSLDLSRVSVDLDEFDRLVDASSGKPAAVARPMLLAALALSRGPVLAHEPYMAWAAQARMRYQGQVLAVTLEAGELALQVQDVESATRLAESASLLDPLSEGVCRLAMRADWAAGRRADALRRYDTFRRALRAEMGVEPAESTKSLFAAILATDASADAPGSERELSALIEAVVDLYHRSHGAQPVGQTVEPWLPRQLAPRQVMLEVPAESGERLLTELFALARPPSPSFAVAR